MANTKTMSLQEFSETLSSANSTLRQALLAKGEEGRITGLSISLKKGDVFTVAPGVEPQLMTVSGKAVIIGNDVAADAYWALRGNIRRGAALIKDVTIPVAALVRLGKEFPGLGADFVRDGVSVPNRSGYEFLQDLLEKFPTSAALYRAQTDYARALTLHGGGEGFSLTVEDVREGYTLPYKAKADRERLEGLGAPWGSKPEQWRKIPMLFLSMERTPSKKPGSNSGRNKVTSKK